MKTTGILHGAMHQLGIDSMSQLFHDVRYGLHMLAKNPGLYPVAVLTLAWVSAPTARFFSVVNSLLLHPLPYQRTQTAWRSLEPLAWGQCPNKTGLRRVSSPPFKEQARSFEDIAINQGQSLNVGMSTRPERVGAVASSAIYSPSRRQAHDGRSFCRKKTGRGKPHTLILSYGFWQRQFGGDPKVLEKSLC